MGIVGTNPLGKENEIRWMRQEVEGYKTLRELPEYRYCEVYDEAGVLHDRKMPVQEPLSEIESYEHVLYARSFGQDRQINIPLKLLQYSDIALGYQENYPMCGARFLLPVHFFRMPSACSNAHESNRFISSW